MQENLTWLTKNSIESVIEQYSSIIFKICMIMLCNEHDAEDALQETFIRYMKSAPSFNEEEHRKAWLIKVASNICKDVYRFKVRHPSVNIDDLQEYYQTKEDGEILTKIMELPAKYKIVLLLYYVEGYKVDEISSMIACTSATIKKRLQRGRKMLKMDLERSGLYE